MKYRNILMRVGILIGLCVGVLTPGDVYAATTPNLVISQFKITSNAGQFVTLYNQADSVLDLGQYELDYINSAGKVTSLPISGQLLPNGFYMVSDDQIRLCYQMTIAAESLSFATTGGSLQVWQVSGDKTVKQLQDSVSWANKAANGIVALPTQNTANTVSLLRQPLAGNGGPQIAMASSGSWQAVAPDATNPCTLNTVATQTPLSSLGSNPGNTLGTGAPAPASIIHVNDDEDGDNMTPTLPAADIGLNAPQITELLPNPAGSGNDDTDEFIELYNPNDAGFDLSGFVLQTGTTSKHKYTFPQGTLLPAKGFVAFYSGDTGLSLSNTTSMAELLDPFGNIIAATDAYKTAKDGLTWASANGKWYWTTIATPGVSNTIKQAVAKTSSTSKVASTASAVKSASTSKVATNAANTAGSVEEEATKTPLHPVMLAAVVALAVGYGVYEYRHDLANAVHKFRSNRSTRSSGR